ncbi:MAG: hypothetical protein K5897_00300 [Eubacterium sp.]|nr:hypothetical protein [Eubacterium sp.]
MKHRKHAVCLLAFLLFAGVWAAALRASAACSDLSNNVQNKIQIQSVSDQFPEDVGVLICVSDPDGEIISGGTFCIDSDPENWVSEFYEELPQGTQLTLEAKPEPGYRFVCWMTGVGQLLSKDSVFTYTAETDMPLYAVFEEIHPGWRHNAKGWWYIKEDGSYASSEWMKIGGKWYRFKADGFMKTGWMQESDGKWYFLNPDGAMQTGWKKIKGVWYFFRSNGSMQTGWRQIKGKWYWFKADGAMVADTSVTIRNKLYHFDKNGACIDP